MRFLLVSLGHVCVVVGVIGIPLPILPTTPFLLLAAFFYSRGSKRFHNWLQSHPRLGPMVSDWNRHGVIGRRAKRFSSLLIVSSLVFPLFFRDFHWAVKGAVICVGIGCLAFINTRPSEPPNETSKQNSELAA